MCIEERFKKYILEEFEKLKNDGFTVNESTLKTVSEWKQDILVNSETEKVPR